MSNNSIFADLAALRLAPDNTSLVGTREVLTHVPVRKPNRHDFFRVHPDPDMSLVTAVFLDKEENEVFFVTPDMRDALLGEIRPVLLMTAVTRQGVVMIWPMRIAVDGARREDQAGRTPASSVLVSSKARPLASTAQAMRASLLASAIASTLGCNRFLAASIQDLSP